MYIICFLRVLNRKFRKQADVNLFTLLRVVSLETRTRTKFNKRLSKASHFMAKKSIDTEKNHVVRTYNYV